MTIHEPALSKQDFNRRIYEYITKAVPEDEPHRDALLNHLLRCPKCRGLARVKLGLPKLERPNHARR